jgi:hypothetical protein
VDVRHLQWPGGIVWRIDERDGGIAANAETIYARDKEAGWLLAT